MQEPQSQSQTTVQGPGALTPDRALRAILFFKPRRGQRIWPWLIGPTGAGKTSRVRALAEELNRPVTTLLLGTMLAEEVLGIPSTQRGVTRWGLPEWAAPAVERPHLIFLDEVDKARPEVLSTVLTLLAESRVRDTLLHPETLFVLAGQPVEEDFTASETGAAIRARTVPIPVPYCWGYLSQQYGIDLSFLPAPEVPIPPAPEVPTARQVQWTLEFYLNSGEDLDLVRYVARLILGKRWADRILDSDSLRPSPESIVRGLVKDPARTDSLPPAVLEEVLPTIVVEGTLDIFRRALIRLVGDQCEEDAHRALRRLYERLAERARSAGGPLQIFRAQPDASGSDWAEAINSAAREIAARWAASAGGQK